MTVDVANGLHRRGVDVSVVTYSDRRGPSFYPLDFGIRRIEAKSRRLGGAPESRKVAARSTRRRSLGVVVWLARYGPKILGLRRALRTLRPDVAVGFLPSSFPYLCIAAAGSRTRVVSSLHNVPGRDLGLDPQRWDQNWLDVWVRRRSLRWSDAITVLLEEFVDQLEPAVRSRTQVIPNPIPPAEGALADPSDGYDNVVLVVGRLSPAKDHATLLAAWAMIEDRHPSWRLLIVGDGPLEGELHREIARLGVDCVSIEPSTPDIDSVYRSAQIFAMPSRYEGFGLVTAEAMARGLPVIGFADCPGTNSLVDQSTGILVEPGEDRARSFAAELSQLMSDERRRVRLGRGGPERVAAYDPVRVIERWLDLFRSLEVGDEP